MDTSNPYLWLLADVCTSVVCQLHDFTDLLQKFQAHFGVFALSWP
jgi:NADH:ubiquinone oxidoreductase subunit E